MGRGGEETGRGDCFVPMYSPSTSELDLFGTQHTGFLSLHVRSTTDTSGTGTRKAIPVSLLEDKQKVSCSPIPIGPFP